MEWGQQSHLSKTRTKARGPSTTCIAFRSINPQSWEYFDDDNLTANIFEELVGEVFDWKHTNFSFCFFPIYSPELNVAEFFFAQMKNDTRRELFTSPQLDAQQWHRKIQAISNRLYNNQRDSSIVLAHVETMCDVMIQCNENLAATSESVRGLRKTTRSRCCTNKTQRYR